MAEAPVIQALEGLPTALRVTRLARGYSLRKVARELGVSFSTIYRIEAGEDCNLSNAAAALRWIANERDADNIESEASCAICGSPEDAPTAACADCRAEANR